jgi:2,5-diketo-D-gluconate reductase B
VSPARVILAWLYEYDLKLIVKASSRDHLRDNLAARSLELDAADVEKIESIRDRTRLFDREGAPWNQ